MKKNQSEIKQILKAGVLMVILSIILLSTRLSFDYTFNQNLENEKTKTLGNLIIGENQENPDAWTKYINEEFFVSFSYPSFLSKNEFRQEGGYDFFVRLEENNVSKGKGVALGIRRTSFEEELERVKDEILEQGAVLVKEEELDINGEEGRVLEFKPEEENDLEARSFLIVRKNDFNYSLSTVPEQMQKVIDSFDFLDE